MPSVKTVLRDIHDYDLDPKKRLKLEDGTKRLGEVSKKRSTSKNQDKDVVEPTVDEKKYVKSALVELQEVEATDNVDDTKQLDTTATPEAQKKKFSSKKSTEKKSKLDDQ